ncbi:hypothetical protein, partial [Enterococcus florum]|uniref:hypothetical protein n=1 Tax=Enterococcus florum TaxID=2480627 RepID=UPI001D131EB6
KNPFMVRISVYFYVSSFSKYEKEKMFFSFMLFMKYTGISMFCNEGNKYIFLSTKNNMQGFCFEIEFFD